MAWKPIEESTKLKRKVSARDADGNERWTWFEDGDWYYDGWRENDDQEEFESVEAWNPIEYEDSR